MNNFHTRKFTLILLLLTSLMAFPQRSFGGWTRTGDRAGVGMVLSKDLLVTKVLPKTPAASSAIRIDDKILALDGHDTDNMSDDQVCSLIRGKLGTTIVIRIKHKSDGKVEEVKLKRVVLPGE